MSSSESSASDTNKPSVPRNYSKKKIRICDNRGQLLLSSFQQPTVQHDHRYVHTLKGHQIAIQIKTIRFKLIDHLMIFMKKILLLLEKYHKITDKTALLLPDSAMILEVSCSYN